LLNITTEDSLFLMYRRNAADDWHVYPYYTKNIVGSTTDKRGTMTIDSLQLGEYTFAMKDYLSTGIQNNMTSVVNGITVYPNPAKNSLTVDLSNIKKEIERSASIVITDVSGKVIITEKLTDQQELARINTGNLNNGIYFITVKNSIKNIARSKFVVSH
jgi:hypothetical protein